ncbi:MAG: ABC transporter ATP-binding protein, partial [Alcaligenaceae bacterium]|nr:ABC transporter ATP-binding protein [Alcaligenaceae bacterium]
PTNDLDIETLELLEELLQDFNGTVLLVSHDRTFLNNVITQTIAYEGDGNWRDYVGGYDDWLEQRPADVAQKLSGNTNNTPEKKVEAGNPASQPKPRQNKPSRLSSWELKELEALPDDIATLEAEQAELTAQLSDPELYKDGADTANSINERLQKLEEELLKLFDRWELLEAKRAIE